MKKEKTEKLGLIHILSDPNTTLESMSIQPEIEEVPSPPHTYNRKGTGRFTICITIFQDR